MVINPYYPPASDEGLYQWFAHVCAGVDLGVWLFDTSYSGVTLSTELTCSGAPSAMTRAPAAAPIALPR